MSRPGLIGRVARMCTLVDVLYRYHYRGRHRRPRPEDDPEWIAQRQATGW